MEQNEPPGTLRVLLQRQPEEPFEPDSVAEAPLVRFAAYARHERVFGWVRLTADRLTDLLNAHDTIVLVDVQIEDLDDGRTRSAERFVIAAADLIAVQATGPRGDAAHRQRTSTRPVAIGAGQYLIGGHLHAPHGSDPLDALRSRPSMVPLTDAWVEYWSGSERTSQAVGTIIVNRRAADWVRSVTDEGALRPLPSAAPIGPDTGAGPGFAGASVPPRRRDIVSGAVSERSMRHAGGALLLRGG